MALAEKMVTSSCGEELTEAIVLLRTRAPDLESVRKLNCWACNLGSVRVVRNMPNLEVCSLTINRLKSLQDFAHCHNLQELYVRTNDIQHLSDIHYLKHLKKLRSLWLSENPCTERLNYRMTVLKTLPHLQKLDNIAVTEEEVRRAQTEGDDLPLPNDFSCSGIIAEFPYNSEERGDNLKQQNSDSSEKWALPRKKRQQKKREDYWKEKRGAKEDSESAKSEDGGDSSTRSGDDASYLCLRSSSDSGDGEGQRVVSSCDTFKSEALEQKLSDNSDDCVDKVAHDECNVHTASVIVQSSSPQHIDTMLNEASHPDHAVMVDLQATKTDIPDVGDLSDVADIPDVADLSDVTRDHCLVGSDQASLVEDLEEDSLGLKDNIRTPDKSICPKIISNNIIRESHLLSDTSAVLKDPISSVEDSTDTTLNETVGIKKVGRNLDVAQESLNMTEAASNDAIPVSSSFSISSNGHEVPQVQNSRDSQLLSSAVETTSFIISEKTTTPLLDKIKLEDTIDFFEDHKTHTDNAMKQKGFSNLPVEFLTTDEDRASDTTSDLTDTAKSSALPSVSNNKTIVNLEEHNQMRIQLGIKPVDVVESMLTSTSADTAQSTYKSAHTKARNTNILQAVLSLIKELDRDSLDIVANAVGGRLDNMSSPTI